MQALTNTEADMRAIHSVLNNYAFAIDTRDWPTFRGLFDKDSVAVYHGLGEFHGPDDILALVNGVISQCGPTQHLIGTVDIDLQDTTASVRSYLQAIHIGLGSHEGQRYTVWGEYHDRLEKRGERWVFTRRELHTLHSEGDIGIVVDED